ncbi:hypothetical protein F5B17DRAFT_240377 [Nemania serpens]|nr:hypothetical protein F5B17DRAFT_240377 [Nemania serpens]
MSIAPSDLPKDKAKCVPPIPVPTLGATGGVFAVACSTRIAGPALASLEKVLDLPSYGSWNTFVPEASLVSVGPTMTESESALPPELRAVVSRPGYVSPGAKIRFHAVMTPGGAARAVDLEVTALEAFNDDDGDGPAGGKGKGYRVAWKAVGMPSFLLRSERVQEFVEHTAPDGTVETRYACWETFGGWLAYVLPRGQLEDGFTRWMDGLKKVVGEAGR